jgi:hypothetical protein
VSYLPLAFLLTRFVLVVEELDLVENACNNGLCVVFVVFALFVEFFHQFFEFFVAPTGRTDHMDMLEAMAKSALAV